MLQPRNATTAQEMIVGTKLNLVTMAAYRVYQVLMTYMGLKTRNSVNAPFS